MLGVRDGIEKMRDRDKINESINGEKNTITIKLLFF